MAHLALFRKYRSQDFDELTGQDRVSVTLRNALRLQRVAHAYLFCGPRGTGKTSTARIFAKALNCERTTGPDFAEQPCNRCALCLRITEGNCLDVMEMDAASHTGVDNIRDAVIGKVDFAPVEGRRKVYIIDEVHKLSGAAFSALLKTLEEPPPHLVFILATTDPHDVPATILSRCQRFDFRRIGQREIIARLSWICEQEALRIEPDALRMVAEAADGSLRDALVVLEQVAAYADGAITTQSVVSLLGITDASALFDLAQTLLHGDLSGALSFLDRLVLEGRDLVQLARDLLGHCRNLLLLRVMGDANQILRLAEDQLALLHQQAHSCAPATIMRVARGLLDLEQELKDPAHARLNWEVAVIRWTMPAAEAGPVTVMEPAKPATPTRPETPVSSSVIPEAPLPPPRVEGPPMVEAPPSPRAPSPPPPVEESQGGVNLQNFRQAWQKLLENVKKERKMPLYAVLVEAEPLAVEGDVCVVGLGSRFRFHLERIEVQRQDIGGWLSTILGLKVTVQVRISDSAAAADKQSAEMAMADPHENFVQEGLEIFGGRIV